MKVFFIAAIFMITTGLYAKGMMAHNPYVRLLPPTAKTTGAFMTLMNHSKEDRKLIKAKSKLSEKVEIHNHLKIDGMMKMREVSHILIKKDSQVELKPGSYHIMLINLHRPLKKGQKVPIELVFENGESLNIKAPVKSIQSSMNKMKHKH